MRYLVLSDIHANLEALETVLAAASSEGYDEVVVLGDLVGYGADPNAVVQRVRALEPVAVIRGNHDKVAAGLESADGFNPTAQRSAAWTRQTLSADNLEYLASLDMGPLAIDEHTVICHGSPVDEDIYIFGAADVSEALSVTERRLCLFGHTHLPMATVVSEDGDLELIFQGPRERQSISFRPGCRYLINPGSVGQPRDGDPRAAYAVLDVEQGEIEISRVQYPVEAAAEKILAAGLPQILAQRLLIGR